MKWLKTEFPKIKKAAKTQGADIYFGDAAHIRSDHHAGRCWGKKGETPIVATTGARHGMSLLSAITSKGHMRFMVKAKGGVNSDAIGVEAGNVQPASGGRQYRIWKASSTYDKDT